MKYFAAMLLALSLLPAGAHAASINLATLTCARYENEILPNAGAGTGTDSINTVMWLLGYSVAQSGDHTMYGESLAPFGFALDAQCRNNPNQSMLEALAAVKPVNKNPMDLTVLPCTTFVARHLETAKKDAESADTIMMWLFGFAVSKSGSHVFDGGGLHKFETALLDGCTANPNRSVYDQLVALKFSG
jgi:hypothetical protein